MERTGAYLMPGADLQLALDLARQAGVTFPAIRPIGFPDAPHYRGTLKALAS